MNADSTLPTVSNDDDDDDDDELAAWQSHALPGSEHVACRSAPCSLACVCLSSVLSVLWCMMTVDDVMTDKHRNLLIFDNGGGVSSQLTEESVASFQAGSGVHCPGSPGR